MKRYLILSVTVFLLNLQLCFAQKISLPAIMSDAGQQSKLMITEMAAGSSGRPELVSPKTLENGELKMVPSRDWTSGFFPGVLWFLYEYTGQTEWRDQAERFTANIEREKTNGGTHDMGFKIYCSVGAGYRLTGNEQYKNVIVDAARTLATRFNKNTGLIKSWDNTKWQFPVIIDNMMNLELLFAATQLSGDSSFYRIADSHAATTMKNHFRSDYSSWHVVNYDTVTGAVIQKATHQGYSDQSAWARGQAWGLYGYTMCYRFTKDKKYLQQAENIAAFILNNPHLPEDLIPYYDFDAPGIPDEPRDASAAAVIASALYELSQYSRKGKYYKKTANKMMKSLTDNYRSPLGASKGFILIHSTGSKPANSEVDVPLSYADYYYMEALMRSRRKGRI